MKQYLTLCLNIIFKSPKLMFLILQLETTVHVVIKARTMYPRKQVYRIHQNYTVSLECY